MKVQLFKKKNKPEKTQVKKVKIKEKEDFLENLGLMISSGVNVLGVLKSLKEDTKSPNLKITIENLEADIKNGIPLWKAFANTKILNENMLNIIKIGEESGRLTENLQIVIDQQRKDREFKSKIRNASLYPAFVLILILVIGLAISIFVLPRMSSVYSALNIELPFITKIIIDFGSFMEENGIFVVPTVIALFVVVGYGLFIDKKTKYIGQKMLLRTPVIRRIIIEVEVSRMGYLLGSLLDAGYPILDSLSLLYTSSSFKDYKDFYKYLRNNMENGISIKKSFETYPKIEKFFPTYARQLIISAEQSGNLAQTLTNIGKAYEKKNEITTKDLNVLLEPILLLIVWLGVAFIAIGVILPIYNLIGNLGDTSSSTTNPPVVEDSEIIDEGVEEEDQIVSFPEN